MSTSTKAKRSTRTRTAQVRPQLQATAYGRPPRAIVDWVAVGEIEGKPVEILFPGDPVERIYRIRWGTRIGFSYWKVKPSSWAKAVISEGLGAKVKAYGCGGRGDSDGVLGEVYRAIGGVGRLLDIEETYKVDFSHFDVDPWCIDDVHRDYLDALKNGSSLTFFEFCHRQGGGLQYVKPANEMPDRKNWPDLLEDDSKRDSKRKRIDRKEHDERARRGDPLWSPRTVHEFYAMMGLSTPTI